MPSNLLLGNPMQALNEGMQIGRQNHFNQLAGQAVAAAPDQRADLIAQAAQADPRQAVALNGALTQQDDTAEDRRNKTMVNMSRMLLSVPESQRDQIYQRMKPQLANFGLSQVPDVYTPEVGQTAQSIVDAWTPINAMPSGAREFQAQAAAAGLKQGTPEYQNAAKVALGVSPRAVTGAAKTGMITGADGRERPYVFDPATQQYSVYDGATWSPLGQQDAARLAGAGGGAMAPSAPQRPSTDQLMRQATQMANEGGPGKNQAGAQAWLYDQLDKNGYRPSTSVPAAPAASGNGGLGVGRAPEETAGAVQNAKNASDLAYLPQTEEIKTHAAIEQAGGAATAKGNAERQLDQPQAQASLNDASTNLDRMSQAANDLIHHPGLNGITSWNAAVPDAPGSSAANARALLTSLKSQIGFGVLQAMRNASKTGGALGSVSDSEGVRLENNLAALEQSQSPAAFKQNLQKIIEYAKNTKGRLSNAYQQTYQPAAPTQPSGGGGQDAPVDDLLSKYGIH